MSLAEDLSVKRMVKFEGDGSLKAFCDLSVGEAFLIRGLRVVEGRNGLFVSMPRQQSKNQKWFDSVVMLNPETKREVGRIVMDAYEKSDESH